MKSPASDPAAYFDNLRKIAEYDGSALTARPLSETPAHREWFIENRKRINNALGIELRIDQPSEALKMISLCKGTDDGY